MKHGFNQYSSIFKKKTGSRFVAIEREGALTIWFGVVSSIVKLVEVVILG